MMEMICCAAVVIAVLALIAAICSRRRTKRVLKHLDHMLDAALAGTFTEQNFDESLLSAIESRFAHYLTANTVSTQKLQEEKDTIKTLIADISHQTKTPIANVRLYTQLLKEAAPDCEAYTTALDSQTQKLQSLIDAQVKTSRLETGALAFHPRPGS